jgi:hypothetical protein
MENMPIFIAVILLIEAALFLFFVIALIIKVIERIKEIKDDKYKNIKK